MSIMLRTVRWFASKLRSPRVIWDGVGKDPSPAPKPPFVTPPSHPPMNGRLWVGQTRPSLDVLSEALRKAADGSDPFDKYGNPKPEAIWPKGWGIYLHCIHRGDSDLALHNHPWKWAVSIILAGGYIEERRGDEDIVYSRNVRPGSINIIRSSDFHRVDLLNGECWSLFIVGPKFSGWGFWDRHTGEFTEWRQYLAKSQR